MILRALATVVLLALLALAFALPSTSIGRRGSEPGARRDVEGMLDPGRALPPFELVGLDGRPVSGDELRGSPLLLVLERSIDWCPFTKMRLLQLREAFADTPDLRIVWVMSEAQISPRTRIFIDELGLGTRILFLADPKSRLIRKLGLLKPDPEPIEKGVPHPTTLLLDREGRVRLIDVREDYHIWLDPSTIARALQALESEPTAVGSPD